MAITQIVPIFLTLKGDGSATTFVFAVQSLFQAGFGGSVPFGVTGVVPSSVVVNQTPFPVTSATIDANGNITITFTSAPTSTTFTIELDIVYNSGAASSSTPTVSQNVTLTGTSTVSISGTTAVTQSTSPWVTSLASTTITGTVAVTQSTSPWVVAGNLTHNNAAPTSNNVGVLPASASASAPTYTTGDQVLLSTDLAGNLRVISTNAVEQNVNLNQWSGTNLGTPTNFGTTPTAVIAGSVNASIFAGTTALSQTGGSLNANVTNTVATTLASTTITGTVAVTQSTSPWVTSLASTTITGTVAVTQSTSPWVTSGGGTLTHNNAAPTANNVGVLPAVASTAAPTYTTGDQVLLSTDLAGNLRTLSSASPLSDLVGTLVALNAANAAATLNAFGYLAIGGFIAAGTLAGTVVAECSFDGGTTWTATYFDIGNKVSSIVFTNPNAATSFSIVASAGASNYRVRVSAFTSGTANCTLRANEVHDPTAEYTGIVAATVQPPIAAQTGGWVTTAAPTYSTTTFNTASLTTGGGLRTDLSSVVGTATVVAAAGIQKVGISGNAGASVDAVITAGTAAANMLQVGSVYNSTIPTLTTGQSLVQQVDTTGSLYINQEGRKQTYSAASIGFTPIATTTVTYFFFDGKFHKDCSYYEDSRLSFSRDRWYSGH